MRLDRLLANLGVASRSGCRELIAKGRVAVDGKTAKSGAEQVTDNACVTVDGQTLDTRLERHLMLYKPSGILTAAEDGKQQTVMELLPDLYRACGCMPIGRLDKDTTGILLFTTDGELAHRLIAPQHHVDKVYEAQVDGKLDETDKDAFAGGIAFKDFTAMPAKLEILSPDTARVTVQEGKYHQVKRMFASRGKPVVRLHRASFGSLRLDPVMKPGDFRELTQAEADELYREAGINR